MTVLFMAMTVSGDFKPTALALNWLRRHHSLSLLFSIRDDSGFLLLLVLCKKKKLMTL